MYTAIINADDFGLSGKTNRAINNLFSMGLISSTTIMANMPGFEEACRMSFAGGFSDRVGIHINLTQGQPLTNSIRVMRKLCSREGEFIFGRSPYLRHLPLSHEERLAVAAEISAQIGKCRKHGLLLSHLDSHHHIHTALPIFSVVAEIAKIHGIFRIRLSANTHDMSRIKSTLKKVFNFRLRYLGFCSTRYFGGLSDFIKYKNEGLLKNGLFEVMIHPIFNDAGKITDIDSKHYNLESNLRGALEGVKIVSYSGLETVI